MTLIASPPVKAKLTKAIATLPNKQINSRNLKNYIPPKDLAYLIKHGFAESLYIYLGNKQGICKHCGKPSNFRSFSIGYNKYCSSTCAGIVTQQQGQGRMHRPFHSKLEKIFIKNLSIDNYIKFKAKIRNKDLNTWKKIKLLSDQLDVSESCIVYHMFVDSKVGRCLHCSDPTSFTGGRYLLYCCVQCANKDASKAAQTKRGKATRLKRYGGHHLRLKEFQDKCRATNILHHGTEWPMQNTKILQKAINTNIKRYGVKRPAQNASIMYNTTINGYCWKNIKIDGYTFRCRGYENFALNELARHHEVSLIINDPREIPAIYYIENNTKKRYYADCMIGDTLYEVKSPYTLGICSNSKYQKQWFITTLLKANAVEEAGYNYICIVYDKDGNRLYYGKLRRSRKFYQILIQNRILKLRLESNS